MNDVLRVKVLQSFCQADETLLCLFVIVRTFEIVQQIRLDGAVLAEEHEDEAVSAGLHHLTGGHDILVFDVLRDEHLILQTLLRPRANSLAFEVEDLTSEVHR